MARSKSVNKHDDREHAPLPPSASGRWMNCAPSMGYVAHLIDNRIITKRVSGEAAERGTRIHELAEPMIVALIEKGKLSKPPKGADADEVEEAVGYANYCYEIWLAANDYADDVQWGVEQRANVTDDCWGSCDFWIYAARRLTTIDLKTGVEDVPAKDNTQLLIYSMGVIREKKFKRVDEVENIIYKSAFGPGTADAYVYEPSAFNDWAKTIQAGIKEASWYLDDKHDRPTLEARQEAGPWCQWCDALAVCPTAKTFASATISANFSPVPITSKLPATENLEPEQVGEILRRAPTFTAWLEAVNLRALELAHKGEVIPGFKVVQKVTRRAWESKYTPAMVAKKVGLPLAKITETRLLSPAKLEKLLPSEKRSVVDDLTFRPVGAATIVKDSDRRQAIASSKISFEPVSREEEE